MTDFERKCFYFFFVCDIMVPPNIKTRGGSLLQDDKIRISTVRRGKRHGTRPHFHRDHELYYLEEGKSKMFVETKLYSLSEGSLVFIKRGRIHKTLSADNNTHVRTVLMFSDDVVKELKEAVRGELGIDGLDSVMVYVPEIMRTAVKQVLKEIESEIELPDCMSDIMVRSKIMTLLINMFRQYERESYEYRSNQNMLDEVIRNAINYIRKNFGSDINLVKTANYVNMSATYFSKKFKRETGIGFKEYLCKFRLHKAEEMLGSPDFVSVTDVAEKCGFSDSNYFSTAFKKEYGVSPNKFRHLSGN